MVVAQSQWRVIVLILFQNKLRVKSFLSLGTFNIFSSTKMNSFL